MLIMGILFLITEFGIPWKLNSIPYYMNNEINNTDFRYLFS